MGSFGDVHRSIIVCLEHGGEVVTCRAMAEEVACDNGLSSCLENENEESLSVGGWMTLNSSVTRRRKKGGKRSGQQ